jgi:hypothetical protein
MSEYHELLAIYKIAMRNEIREVKTAGEPTLVDTLPSDTNAKSLLWLRWSAAMRDSLMLYDGKEVYEKHVDDIFFRMIKR